MNGDADVLTQGAGRLPGVGEAGSTPTTDLTNLNVARAMERSDVGQRFGFGSPQYIRGRVPSDDLIDMAFQRRSEVGPQSDLRVSNTRDLHNQVLQEISDRRDDLEGRKRKIMAQLGIISPQQGGYSAVVLPSTNRGRSGVSQRDQLLQDLQVLEHESDRTLREHHYVAGEFARQAHEDFVLEKEINASKDFAGLSRDLMSIHQRLKPGTKAYEDAIIEARMNHPEGSRSQAGVSLLKEVSGLHDDETALHGKLTSQVVQRYARVLGDVKSGIKGAAEEKAALEASFPALSKTSSPAPATSASAAAAGPAKTEVIEKGGHHYEVDHAAKKVLRQID
jgi:hypothetical protein